jgi:hypothetical protein
MPPPPEEVKLRISNESWANALPVSTRNIAVMLTKPPRRQEDRPVTLKEDVIDLYIIGQI